ncbi:MAG: hypothetical protein J6M95_00150 [Bacilli bacterium]|nr:hypothetical protein [Bacilli bacterium]
MFGKELAHDETYYKEYGEYKLSSSYSVYEAYIEPMFNKEGKAITNKDGSPRYRYIDDRDITTISEDKTVKAIRDNLFKDVYSVNGDYVEKVEKDNRRVYYVVDPEKVTTLKKDSKVLLRNGLYRLLSEVGYVLVDDYDIENPKVVGVKKFKTEDHEAEAKEIIKNKIRRSTGEEE